MPRPRARRRARRARLAVALRSTRRTGAAALALEVVYFRLVDGIMRSNSYTFAHVLTLYLVLFGAGAAAAGERARRATATRRRVPLDPILDRRSELARRALLLNVPPLFGLREALEQYFAGEGFIYGFESVTDLRSTRRPCYSRICSRPRS